MSWCRFSTILPNKRTSDLYIYDDFYGGVTIHVAAAKRANIEKAPLLSPIGTISSEEWLIEYTKRMEWFRDNKEFENIGLKYDGESFCNLDKETLISTLHILKKEGYQFPETVFELAIEYEEV
jgi:hypothetical protein